MSVDGGDLGGRRILIVEDEFLTAQQLEICVHDAGGKVVGPVASVDDALPIARTQGIDAALLDVNLRGRMVTPVAEELQARGIPFVLVTAYGREALQQPVLRDAPLVAKANLAAGVCRVLIGVFAARPHARQATTGASGNGERTRAETAHQPKPGGARRRPGGGDPH